MRKRVWFLQPSQNLRPLGAQVKGLGQASARGPLSSLSLPHLPQRTSEQEAGGEDLSSAKALLHSLSFLSADPSKSKFTPSKCSCYQVVMHANAWQAEDIFVGIPNAT